MGFQTNGIITISIACFVKIETGLFHIVNKFQAWCFLFFAKFQYTL